MQQDNQLEEFEYVNGITYYKKDRKITQDSLMNSVC